MADELVEIENLCCALVGNAEHEGFVVSLLRSPKGQWHNVCDLIRQTGTTVGGLEFLAEDLFVTWLDDAVSTRGFVSIIFHHYETLWTMCAHYNHQRLFGGTGNWETGDASR